MRRRGSKIEDSPSFPALLKGIGGELGEVVERFINLHDTFGQNQLSSLRFDAPSLLLYPKIFFVCLPLVPTAAIVSSEQNPVIIIAVVAVAGTIILVFMVFGFIIGRRYALAGPIDSPLL